MSLSRGSPRNSLSTPSGVGVRSRYTLPSPNPTGEIGRQSKFYFKLYDHFKKYATKEERLQNMPTDVNEAEWKFLVEYFDSDTFKRMSEPNRTNKAKQEINHICGRKSFQAVSFEQRNTSTGKEPNLQKLWELTHMKNGHWINDASAELNNGVSAAFLNIISNLSGSDEASCSRLMDDITDEHE
ncbi:uncharacterized protein LOC107802229 isoform X3 [Nicotiana tabacum]|uniref:Uncharacterized protein LOC107802229 isoform X3 n=1 Tax=Nicotiana tabacum TaxID=4097 RepID=A0A1S4AXB5_TOBAC|nr:PREDICTED: uncharacterized protein LOC107802229 isoform X3 [Nicotiana tabacum]